MFSYLCLSMLNIIIYVSFIQHKPNTHNSIILSNFNLNPLSSESAPPTSYSPLLLPPHPSFQRLEMFEEWKFDKYLMLHRQRKSILWQSGQNTSIIMNSYKPNIYFVTFYLMLISVTDYFESICLLLYVRRPPRKWMMMKMLL